MKIEHNGITIHLEFDDGDVLLTVDGCSVIKLNGETVLLEQPDLDDLKAAFLAFGQVQEQYSNYGAQDTESCGVFHCFVREVYNTRKKSFPDGWSLYESKAGWQTAHRALNKAAEKIADIILALPRTEEVRSYLRKVCWRVSF